MRQERRALLAQKKADEAAYLESLQKQYADDKSAYENRAEEYKKMMADLENEEAMMMSQLDTSRMSMLDDSKFVSMQTSPYQTRKDALNQSRLNQTVDAKKGGDRLFDQGSDLNDRTFGAKDDLFTDPKSKALITPVKIKGKDVSQDFS